MNGIDDNAPIKDDNNPIGAIEYIDMIESRERLEEEIPEEPPVVETNSFKADDEYPDFRNIIDIPDEDILYGDADCDGEVAMNDIVLIMQSLANPNKFGLTGTDEHHITEKGQLNADVYENGKSGITNNDAMQIQKYLLGLVKSLEP